MSNLAYYRVSTESQSIESQRASLVSSLGGVIIDREFIDEGVSGAIPAKDRAGFKALLEYVREGDTIHVNAVDRLGRDAIDIQTTARGLIDKGVAINVKGLGVMARGVGEIILAVLAQVADMERAKIAERTEAGRNRAKELLATTGKTQHGKTSLGRPMVQDAAKVKAWRDANKSSIADTASHFGISIATVKRYCSA